MDRSFETAARDVELTPPSAPARRRWGLLAVYLAVIAIVVAGGWALAARDDPTAEPPEPTIAPSSTERRSPEELFEALPASPIDGKQSQRLPVLATTQSELVDGQRVTVLGKGFEPGEQVGAVMCAAEAALEGVAACELGRNGTFDLVAYAEASSEGFVRVDVAVRTLIETPFTGPLDCLSGPERCIIAIGAVGDYDRSGGTAIGFVGQPAFAEPSLAVSGVAPYEPGATVDVNASGLLWPREVAVHLCLGEQCAALARGRVTADGTFVTPVVVPSSFTLADGTPVSCETTCELRLAYLALEGTTQAPEPPPHPVTFTWLGPSSAAPIPTIVSASTEPPRIPPSTVPVTTLLD